MADFKSEKGDRVFLPTVHWDALIELAQMAGWAPASEVLATPTPSVSKQDARALADALSRVAIDFPELAGNESIVHTLGVVAKFCRLGAFEVLPS